MGDSTVDTDPKLPDHEQEILDTALRESDQLLARSLHDDQRRRRRRVWWSALVIGGAAMSGLLIAILAGWLVIGGQVRVDAKDPGSLEPSATSDPSDLDVERAEQQAEEGWALWRQRKFAASAEKFEAAVELDPESSNAWNGLGWSRFNGGESEKAIVAFQKCVALEPKHPAALNGLGQIYQMWEEYDRAEKYLLMAAPPAPAAWHGLTRMYLLQGKFDEAEPWAAKVIAQNPADPTARKMLAAAQAGKLDNGLRRLIQPPGKPTAKSSDATRGWAMFNQGRMRTAERLFRRALEADDKNMAALNGLGFCLLNQGNHEQAKSTFERYLKIEPDSPGPMNGLARCLKAEGKVDEAVALWEKVLEDYPGPNAATTGLAQTYLERQEYAKAAEYFQQLVDSAPDNAMYRQSLKSAQTGMAARE